MFHRRSDLLPNPTLVTQLSCPRPNPSPPWSDPKPRGRKTTPGYFWATAMSNGSVAAHHLLFRIYTANRGSPAHPAGDTIGAVPDVPGPSQEGLPLSRDDKPMPLGGQHIPADIDHDGLFKQLLLTFFKEFIDLFVPAMRNYGDLHDLRPV